MNKLYNEVVKVKKWLKKLEREKWSNTEKKEILIRGEKNADFYRIWYKLCWLDHLLEWIEKHGYITRSQKRILEEYKRSK